MGSAKILSENDNVVRIMSIHKSKGLEFPVVILSGCGKKFNLQDMNSAFCSTRILASVPMLWITSGGFMALQRQAGHKGEDQKRDAF
jgi:ATP-dependent exoDNAse (exonuclease V) beta subunit